MARAVQKSFKCRFLHELNAHLGRNRKRRRGKVILLYLINFTCIVLIFCSCTPRIFAHFFTVFDRIFANNELCVQRSVLSRHPNNCMIKCNKKSWLLPRFNLSNHAHCFFRLAFRATVCPTAFGMTSTEWRLLHACMACMYIWHGMYVGMYVFIYVCIHIWRVCLYAMYVCMYVCMYVWRVQPVCMFGMHGMYVCMYV